MLGERDGLLEANDVKQRSTLIPMHKQVSEVRVQKMVGRSLSSIISALIQSSPNANPSAKNEKSQSVLFAIEFLIRLEAFENLLCAWKCLFRS